MPSETYRTTDWSLISTSDPRLWLVLSFTLEIQVRKMDREELLEHTQLRYSAMLTNGWWTPTDYLGTISTPFPGLLLTPFKMFLLIICMSLSLLVTSTLSLTTIVECKEQIPVFSEWRKRLWHILLHESCYCPNVWFVRYSFWHGTVPGFCQYSTVLLNTDKVRRTLIIQYCKLTCSVNGQIYCT